MDPAPVKPLPPTKMLCVEYPGFVKNVDRAVATFGVQSPSAFELLRGQKAINAAVRERPDVLEVARRPVLRSPHCEGAVQARGLTVTATARGPCVGEQSPSQAPSMKSRATR